MSYSTDCKPSVDLAVTFALLLKEQMGELLTDAEKHVPDDVADWEHLYEEADYILAALELRSRDRTCPI